MYFLQTDIEIARDSTPNLYLIEDKNTGSWNPIGGGWLNELDPPDQLILPFPDGLPHEKKPLELFHLTLSVKTNDTEPFIPDAPTKTE